MSKPWNPQDEIARVREERPASAWPQGATVGLLLVAGACIGFAALLYQVAGPRDVFGS